MQEHSFAGPQEDWSKGSDTGHTPKDPASSTSSMQLDFEGANFLFGGVQDAHPSDAIPFFPQAQALPIEHKEGSDCSRSTSSSSQGMAHGQPKWAATQSPADISAKSFGLEAILVGSEPPRHDQLSGINDEHMLRPLRVAMF